jgi:23S rRNA U2552 (ribose-2'-O)-methylase RlmE/FtsJ
MNDLRKYFDNNTGRVIHKWEHYFEIYDRHFSPFRNKEIVILEIGVFQGGSLQMWKDYFGPKAKIYGIDIDPKCKQYEENNIEIFIGSQTDEKFLANVKNKIPKIDILIDDGGHTMHQIKTSFLELFDHLKDDGIYAVEDLHTSYWLDYGGGFKRMGTFNEYSKNIIDSIHAWHSRQKSFKIDKYTNTVHSLHYYDSITIIEKRKMKAPTSLSSGVEIGNPFAEWKRTPTEKFIRKMGKMVNIILAYLRLPSVPKI